MNSTQAVEQVCRLPTDLRAGDKSAVTLVRESGVRQGSLTPTEVTAVLKAHPTLIDDWLRWSEDQRCTPAYYFIEEDNGWIVGRQPGNERVEFSDRVAACADFIVKAVNQIW